MQHIVTIGHFGHFSFTLDLCCFFKTIFEDQQQQIVYVTRQKNQDFKIQTVLSL